MIRSGNGWFRNHVLVRVADVDDGKAKEGSMMLRSGRG
jgi:hypothetical protein